MRKYQHNEEKVASCYEIAQPVVFTFVYLSNIYHMSYIMYRFFILDTMLMITVGTFTREIFQPKWCVHECSSIS